MLHLCKKEFEECTDSLYDRNEHLYYRDCSKRVLREPNGAKQFWARGNGWVLAAFPLILENLPEEYLKRDYYIRFIQGNGCPHTTNARCAGILACQFA